MTVIVALRVYDRRVSPCVLLSLFPSPVVPFLQKPCVTVPAWDCLPASSPGGTRFLSGHLFSVTAVQHEDPFLECGPALGFLSHASLGAVILFLKPCSGSVSFTQSGPEASLDEASVPIQL